MNNITSSQTIINEFIRTRQKLTFSAASHAKAVQDDLTAIKADLERASEILARLEDTKKPFNDYSKIFKILKDNDYCIPDDQLRDALSKAQSDPSFIKQLCSARASEISTEFQIYLQSSSRRRHSSYMRQSMDMMAWICQVATREKKILDGLLPDLCLLDRILVSSILADPQPCTAILLASDDDIFGIVQLIGLFEWYRWEIFSGKLGLPEDGKFLAFLDKSIIGGLDEALQSAKILFDDEDEDDLIIDSQLPSLINYESLSLAGPMAAHLQGCQASIQQLRGLAVTGERWMSRLDALFARPVLQASHRIAERFLDAPEAAVFLLNCIASVQDLLRLAIDVGILSSATISADEAIERCAKTEVDQLFHRFDRDALWQSLVESSEESQLKRVGKIRSLELRSLVFQSITERLLEVFKDRVNLKDLEAVLSSWN